MIMYKKHCLTTHSSCINLLFLRCSIPAAHSPVLKKLAAEAFKLNPNSRSIKHTQAEIARRMALDTDDLLRKRALRQVVREKIGKNTSRFSKYEYSTHANLAIDEFRELLDSLNGDDSKQHDIVL